MIITRQKPFEELLTMLGDAKKVVLTGCGQCATVCKTGGEKELEELKSQLAENGIEVMDMVVFDTACNKLLTKKEIKSIKDSLDAADAVICASCGDGVQTLAGNIEMKIYPANDTMFLGEIERQGIFTEACKMCGECVLGRTAAVCPVTKCAKSLTNGPCGGAKDGKCEVNPENDCAWIVIYERLKKLGDLDKLMIDAPARKYSAVSYPRVINLKGGK